MKKKSRIFLLFTALNYLIGQFPIELQPDEISSPYSFSTIADTEYLLNLTASTNSNWSQFGNESATLKVQLDDDWLEYNQDMVLYAGSGQHNYYASLGPISTGEHSIRFYFDYGKSSTGASLIEIDSIELIDIGTLDIDEDVFRHSPILYGRDLLAWNESTHTDIPLIMWHNINQEGQNKRITYSIIFSNEDSRVGIGLAELMYSYGRTTDIEWVYEVLLDQNSNILSENFQGASHTTTVFEGNKIGRHPILKNATLNCNFTDAGTSDYKFFLSPIFTTNENHTREILMDEHPWTYRIMAEELIREDRYENPSDPITTEISDVRNYLYIEWNGVASGQNTSLEIAVNFMGNCDEFVNHHYEPEFEIGYSGGVDRSSIELPFGFDPASIYQLGFKSGGNYGYNMYILEVSRLFYLNEYHQPVNLSLNFLPFNVNDNNMNHWLTVNNNDSNLDCLGVAEGTAECDDCGICNGGNASMDECGVCFGGNTNLDCNGVCFGNSTQDICGVCDDNPNNDNSTCSGCTDVNAENYDETAVFDDGSCVYNDNIFQVPLEYSSIQSAINFAEDGDIVEVGPGIYHENINFQGKSLTLQSQYESSGSIEDYVISGIDSASTVTIENVSVEGASLKGFTITGGYGRGVSFEDFISLAADPEAFDSLITQVLRGGGISVMNASPLLRDLIITENTARNVGAGLGLVNSNAIVESVEIINNTIPDGDALGGGGIAVNGGYPKIDDAAIIGNVVGINQYYLNGGGGILCGFSFDGEPLQLEITNSFILNNTANIGGGLGALSGNVQFRRVLIAGNTGDYGSAISLGEPLGLAINDINLNISHSTITHNNGYIGVGMINSAQIIAVNSIIRDNGEIEFSPLPNNDQLNVFMSYSNTEDEWPGLGNITSDPLFTDPASTDFTLQSSSPCIDAGTEDADEDGNQDIFDFSGTAPDMGAFEHSALECNETGDVNNDNSVNILDIVNVVNLILSDQFDTCADLNSDSNINILDIVIIINQILD